LSPTKFLDNAHPSDKWTLVIRVYDTPALIKGVWIFNPEEMAIERISTEICAKS
jgi:hypothetical protein